MKFLYIDESGTSSFNDPDPIFCILGIDIDESKGKTLIYEYNSLKKYYFPKCYKQRLRDLPTIKEKIKLLEFREKKHILTPADFCYPNRTFIYKVINICTKHNVKMHCVIAFKDKLKTRNPDWLYPACLQILTREYNHYLTKKGARGIIIMDSRGQGLDDKMTFMQSSYLLWGKYGKHYNNVMDLPFFTRSHLSLILQIAHYFAYITKMHYSYIYYKQDKYKYLTPVWQKLSALFSGDPKGRDIIIWC